MGTVTLYGPDMQHRPSNQAAGNMINNLSELTQVAGMSAKKSSALLGSFSWQLQDKLITAFQSFLKKLQKPLFGDPRIFVVFLNVYY